MSGQNGTTSMKIQVGSLSDGIHTYHFDADGTQLELGDRFTRPVGVDATLDKAGDQIFLKATISATGAFICDRCTAEFDLALTANYRMYYVWDPTEADRFDPAEVQYISPALNIIDIAEDIRQTILLAVPLKLLCQEGCEGLCPHCGKNRNAAACSCRDEDADPRWEKLRALKNNFMS